MQLDRAMDFLAERDRGVLVTLKRDGRPQASNILFAASDRTARISVTADRAKTRNVQRDPRVSLHATTDDFWSWVVVEGTASLSPVADEDDPASLPALRRLYGDISGEHPDWDDYDRAMVAERRQVLTIAVTHAYGQLPEG